MELKKIFLCLLIISIVVVFSLAGCKAEAASFEEPVEEEAEEEVSEETTEEVTEETAGETEEEIVREAEEEVTAEEEVVAEEEETEEETVVESEEEVIEEEAAEEEVIVSDEMAEDVGTITDIDGNLYHTVTIGTQVWMVENLKVTHYRNSDSIPNITDGTEWGSLKTGAYCNYNNDPNNVDAYGRLYNWYVVIDSRKICPAGWHVPTYKDWEILEEYLGGVPIAGGKIKEAGTEHWESPNFGATNESGFTALPGGYRRFTGKFLFIGYYGYWWSTRAYDINNAWYNYLGYLYSNLNRYWYSKTLGFSIRCVMD
jgi:uncharacterized protein (TIGR02145 family)